MQIQEELRFLQNDKNNEHEDKSLIEEHVAQKLDDVLETYKDDLMKIPICCLNNIFMKAKGNLTKHDLAYEAIKQYFDKTKNYNIFILLGSLDGQKLSEKNLIDAIESRNQRFGMIPLIDYSIILKIREKIDQSQKTINGKIMEMSTQFNEKLNEIMQLLQKNSNDINKLNKQIEMQNIHIEKLESKVNNEQQSQIINKLDDDIISIKKDIEAKFNQLSAKTKSIKEKIIKNVDKEISSQICQFKTEIESKISSISFKNENELSIIKKIIDSKFDTLAIKNENEIKSLKNEFGSKFESITFKNNNEISVINNKYENEIVLLKKTYEAQWNEITSLRNIYTNEKSIIELKNDHKIDQEISALKQNYYDDIAKYKEENSNDILVLQQKIEKEIEALKQNNSNEISEIKKANKNMMSIFNTRISNETESLNKKYSKEISDFKTNNDKTISSYKEMNSKNIKLLEKTIENHQKDVVSYQNKQVEDIRTIKNDIENIKLKALSIIQNIGESFYVDLDLSSPGILEQLKQKEKNEYEPLFVASQSSNDIYNLIDKKSTDKFGAYNGSDFFIEFSFKESIKINAVQLFSSSDQFLKSFNIQIDGVKVLSVHHAKQLNGPNLNHIFYFSPRIGRKVRLTQTNFRFNQEYSFILKRIEILSPDQKYSKGVFTTLIENSKNKDPHRCGVRISSSNFHFNDFHSINAERNIATFDESNSWFQIELTQGMAIINGFRLKKVTPPKIKCFKIVGTDIFKEDINEWTTLYEMNEKSSNEHQLLDTYMLSKQSPLVKFIRIIQTGPTWSNILNLAFYHFDIFGRYL